MPLPADSQILVTRIRNGIPPAAMEIAERLERSVRRIARRWLRERKLRRPPDSSDVAQDVLCCSLRGIANDHMACDRNANVAGGATPATNAVLPAGQQIRRPVSSGWRIAVLSIGLTVVSFATLNWWFGSLSAACAVLSGNPVIATPTDVDLGTAGPGVRRTATFRVSNHSSRTVTIIGLRGLCSCRLAPPPPIDVAAAGATETVNLEIDFPREPGDFSMTRQLILSDMSISVNPITVHGCVGREQGVPVAQPVHVAIGSTSNGDFQ